MKTTDLQIKKKMEKLLNKNKNKNGKKKITVQINTNTVSFVRFTERKTDRVLKERLICEDYSEIKERIEKEIMIEQGYTGRCIDNIKTEIVDQLIIYNSMDLDVTTDDECNVLHLPTE